MVIQQLVAEFDEDQLMVLIEAKVLVEGEETTL